jgi:hypothetical protein
MLYMKAADPPRKWVRLVFDEEKLKSLSTRERSEIETDRDLIKPIEQLVCDCHEETEANTDQQPIQCMARAQKRMVSMMGKVVLSNNALSRRMEWLTWGVIGLALLQLVVAYLSMPRR